MRKIAAWLRDGWLIVGVCLMTLLIANALLAALLPDSPYVAVKQGAASPDKYSAPYFANESWVDQYKQEFRASRRLVWHPYVYWRRAPYAGSWINVDEAGVRKTPSSSDDPQAPLILFLGGSAAWGSGSRDDFTIPSHLAKRLANAGQQARIVNLGERAYVSGQSLVTLLQWLRDGGETPALAISYDGVNDVYSALQSDHAGWPQNERERRADFGASGSPRKLLVAIGTQFEGISKLLQRTRESTSAPQDLAERIVQHYARTLALASAAAGSETATLFFWQPTVFGKTPLSQFEQRAVDASLQAHRDLQLATNRAVGQSPQLRSRDDFVDFTTLFGGEDETVFMDYAHVSESANAVIAEAMLPYVLRALRTSSE